MKAFEQWQEEGLDLELEFKEEAQSLYNELIKSPEIAEPLSLLDRLPENLRYHAKGHTLDVISDTILFALAGGASPEVTKQQAIAAAWHDTGFVERKDGKGHEAASLKLLSESEGYKNMSRKEQEETSANIFDTQVMLVDGKPALLKRRSKLGYMLDGDVSNFGREDFFEKMEMVAKEQGIDISNPEVKKNFYKSVVSLLGNHEWKTESARKMRQTQKEKNIAKMMEELAKMEERQAA